MTIIMEPRRGGQFITGSGGGGKGGGSARVPVETADSLHNTAYAAVLDVIGNGEMAGPVHPDAPLRDIYLDGTPIQNADGSLNFERVQVDYRVGTVDQSAIAGFPASSSVTHVGAEVKADAPFVQAVTNPELSAVRVSVHVPRLMKMIESGNRAGDRIGYQVDYAIDLKTGSGAFVQVVAGRFDGKTTSGYTRTHRIDLPQSAGGPNYWTLRVRRLTAHATTSAVEDKIFVQSWAQVIDGRFRHPMTALVGIRIDAEQFQSIPARAYHWRGQIIRVPGNYDPVARTYSGVWDGTFKRAWSNNPAWVYYDMLTNALYGLGGRLDAAMIDRYALYQIGAYCDQMVPDGQGGTEPRFVCNAYLQSQADALRVLNDLASVFRGMAYWANGQVVAVMDAPSDPVYTYTNANVAGGRFEYTGADLSTLKTVALVSYNDPTDFYRAKVEVVEDADGIKRWGVRKAEIVAFGCTSRGQAQRVGLYHLYTSRMETGAVAFSVGLDGVIPQPGSLIKIADRNRAGRYIGGRIAAATETAVTLDRGHPAKAGDTLTVNLPDGTAQTRAIVGVAGRTVTVSPAFAQTPVAESVWAIDADDLKTQWVRVVSVAEKDGIEFAISGVLHHPDKYAAIDSNVRLEPLPVSVVPPRVQAAPANIQIAQHATWHQGTTRHTAEITWDAPEHAVRFDVQWRRDNGPWIPLPRTSARMVELHDLYAGSYHVRIRALNALDVSSLWAHASSELDGLAGEPPVLTALTASGEVMAIRLSWAYPQSPNIIERVEIRASQTSSFADGTALTQVAYPADTHTLYGLGYSTEMWFWARLVDKNGEAGAWHPSASDAGVFGKPAQDAGTILDYLEGKIGEGQLAQGLVEQIAGEAAAAVDVSGATQTLQDQLSAMWGVKTQVRADGRVVQTGVALGASIGEDGQSRSEFLVQADTVAFLNTLNGNIHTPFVFDVANDTAFLKSAFIQNASIDNAKIANAAIDNVKIANGAITSAKIGDAQITTAKIGVAEVDTLRIKNHAVTVQAHAIKNSTYGTASTHDISLSITLNQSADLVVIAFAEGYLHGAYQSNTYGISVSLYINGQNFGTTSESTYGNCSEYGCIYSVSPGHKYLKYSASAGTHTVKITQKSYNSPSYKFNSRNASLLVLAAMR